MQNRIRFRLTAILVLAVFINACQKNTAIGTNPATAKPADNPSLIDKVKHDMQPVISSRDFNDLNWTGATIDNSGNGATMVIIKSKTDVNKLLFYMDANPKTYFWNNQSHFVEN